MYDFHNTGAPLVACTVEMCGNEFLIPFPPNSMTVFPYPSHSYRSIKTFT